MNNVYDSACRKPLRAALVLTRDILIADYGTVVDLAARLVPVNAELKVGMLRLRYEAYFVRLTAPLSMTGYVSKRACHLSRPKRS